MLPPPPRPQTADKRRTPDTASERVPQTSPPAAPSLTRLPGTTPVHEGKLWRITTERQTGCRASSAWSARNSGEPSRCEHERSLAATQVHDLGTEPVRQAQLPSESRVIHRSRECKNETVIHRGAADDHGDEASPEVLRNGPTITVARSRAPARARPSATCVGFAHQAHSRSKRSPGSRRTSAQTPSRHPWESLPGGATSAAAPRRERYCRSRRRPH